MDLMWADNAYKFMYPDVIKFINSANNMTEMTEIVLGKEDVEIELKGW